MTQNRKRGRNIEDEVECTPLSKRINNLHINNSMLQENRPSNLAEWGPGPPDYRNNVPETPPTSSESSVDYNMPEYSPALSENQNPHYFNINKLLHEMYIQRVQRGYHQN